MDFEKQKKKKIETRERKNIFFVCAEKYNCLLCDYWSLTGDFLGFKFQICFVRNKIDTLSYPLNAKIQQNQKAFMVKKSAVGVTFR